MVWCCYAAEMLFFSAIYGGEGGWRGWRGGGGGGGGGGGEGMIIAVFWYKISSITIDMHGTMPVLFTAVIKN